MSAPTPDAGQARAYPDTDQALAVLDKAFDLDITRHLVAISENGDVFARSFKFADRTPMRCWIDEQQGKRNVYYSVNELKSGVTNRKAAKDNVGRALYLHVDVDDAGALDRIRQYPPRPTAVVFSGGGYQAFWKLKEPTTDLARVERVNAGLRGNSVAITVTTSTASCACLDDQHPERQEEKGWARPGARQSHRGGHRLVEALFAGRLRRTTPAAPAAALRRRVRSSRSTSISCPNHLCDTRANRTRRRSIEPNRLDGCTFSVAQRSGVAGRVRTGQGRMQGGKDCGVLQNPAYGVSHRSAKRGGRTYMRFARPGRRWRLRATSGRT